MVLEPLWFVKTKFNRSDCSQYAVTAGKGGLKHGQNAAGGGGDHKGGDGVGKVGAVVSRARIVGGSGDEVAKRIPGASNRASRRCPARPVGLRITISSV